jgi:hypothetical protein
LHAAFGIKCGLSIMPFFHPPYRKARLGSSIQIKEGASFFRPLY